MLRSSGVIRPHSKRTAMGTASSPIASTSATVAVVDERARRDGTPPRAAEPPVDDRGGAGQVQGEVAGNDGAATKLGSRRGAARFNRWP